MKFATKFNITVDAAFEGYATEIAKAYVVFATALFVRAYSKTPKDKMKLETAASAALKVMNENGIEHNQMHAAVLKSVNLAIEYRLKA